MVNLRKGDDKRGAYEEGVRVVGGMRNGGSGYDDECSMLRCFPLGGNIPAALHIAVSNWAYCIAN